MKQTKYMDEGVHIPVDKEVMAGKVLSFLGEGTIETLNSLGIRIPWTTLEVSSFPY